MRETNYTKTLYKAIRKLNLDKEELKGTLLCLYINGCPSEDCAKLFGTDKEKIVKLLESEQVYNYQTCSRCGKLRDRVNGFRQFKNQRSMVCNICEKTDRDDNKKQKKEYNKEYYKNNREEIRTNNKEYYNNNRDDVLRKQNKYYEDNKEEIKYLYKQQKKEYYEKNKDKVLKQHKEYQEHNKEQKKEQRKEHYEKNKDKIKKQNKEHYEKNKDKIKDYYKEHNQQEASFEQVQKLAMFEEVSGNRIRCKYCGKWMTPTILQVQNRLNGIEVNDRGYIYCSEECKEECPVYNKQKYPKGFKPASSREVNPVLRQIVLARDEYTCQKCGKDQDELTVGLHCHHITPYINSPIETDDPDNCTTRCKDCHKEDHQIPDCRYNELKCG